MAGLFGGEHPIDAVADIVFSALPVGDFGDKEFLVVDTAIEALGTLDANFDLDDVEPAGVLGGLVEFQAMQDASGLGGREAVVD